MRNLIDFQGRVSSWLFSTFSREIVLSKNERNNRFMEEAAELVQATGMTREAAHRAVDYSFDRPVGEIAQEVGGVVNTLYALCSVHDIDLNDSAETELDRCWIKSPEIVAKQRLKPKFEDP